MRKGRWKKGIALFLSAVMLLGEGAAFPGLMGSLGAESVYAGTTETAGTVITSMDYYDAANGQFSMSGSSATTADLGFVLPKFNGLPSQELALPAVEGDLELLVKQEKGTNGQWVNINDTEYFQFNVTWGWEYQKWSDTADGWICWFKINEQTELRFHGITNDVNLDYTLGFTKLPSFELTSVGFNKTQLELSATGKGGISKVADLVYNGDAGIKFSQVEEEFDKDVEVLVKRESETEFVPLLNNAAAGWIYDQNFGIFTNDGGGWWFNNLDESVTVRMHSKSGKFADADLFLLYKAPVRANYSLSAVDGKVEFDAKTTTTDHSAVIGMCLPRIGGTEVRAADLDLFTYEAKVDGEWKNMFDVAASKWLFKANGYNKFSQDKQWGFTVNDLYELWFRPVKDDEEIRIGYPLDGKKGGEIGENYVYYKFIGDPNANIPDVSDMKDINVDNSDTTGDVTDVTAPEGWNLIWNDEFNGTSLNTNNWANQTGYLLDENDISTYGWGNKELEYYTDSEKNTSVKDGKLNLTLLKEEKVFAEKDDPSKTITAKYSSGKVISQNKFAVKYGRVDFRAKLPTGTGIWPALWMMPNDEVYGVWARSGEIDIMEGRGRTPEIAFGTLHYGDSWPGDEEDGMTMDMLEKGLGSDMSGWHVYSMVWEEDNIKIYCDGKCFYKGTNETWYSAADRSNPNAPFDEQFYLIMNLAAGGYFDGLNEPDESVTKSDMYVDYVRVFQKNAETGDPDEDGDGLYGDYLIATTVPVTDMTLDKTSVTLAAGSSEKLTAAFTPSNATNRSIKWSSSDESVAMVSGGTIQAIKPGSAVITAETADGGIKRTCQVTVTGVEVTGITLTPETAELQEGETKVLTANVLPANASNKNISWTSSNPKVATVADGTVKAVKAGTAVITAKAEGGNFEKTCAVTVKGAAVTGIRLDKTTLELKMGATGKLTATVEPANAENKNVRWTSSNERVATVSNGTVTALKEGEVVITAITEEGEFTAACTVTVTDKEESSGRGDKGIEKDKDGVVTLYITNRSDLATATAYYAVFDKKEEAEAATISKLQGFVMTKNADGVFEYGLGKLDETKYVAYAFNQGIQETPIAIAVADIPYAEGAVEPTTAKYSIEYYQEKADGSGYELVSSEKDTAEIGQTVRAPQMTYTGFTYNPEATGNKAEGTVTLDGSLVLKLYYSRNSYEIHYHLNGGTNHDANPLSYKYGAGVKELKEPVREGYAFEGWYDNAEFTGEKKTSVSITGIGEVDLYAKWVEKIPETVAVTGVTLNKQTLALEIGAAETLTAAVAPSNATNPQVTWSSSNPAVAIVADGKVTALKAGTAVITVTTVDGGKTAVCTVTVTNPPVPTEKTYTVTFNAAGGSKVAAQTVKEGAAAGKPGNPTRKGYAFKGWYLGSTPYNFASPVKTNLTLTAKWSAIRVSKIKITGISKQIAAGKKIKLKATVSPSTARTKKVKWTVSNKKYASITQKGVVTLKKAGIGKTVKVTAKAADGSGKKAVYKIKIMKNAVKKITLKVSNTKVKAGKSVTVKAVVSPTKSLNKKLSWKSSNKRYATVNSKGVVKTKKAGKGKTVTITASATDGSNKKKSVRIKIK